MAGNLKAKVSFLADTKGLLKGVDAVEGRFNKLGKTLERHSAKLMGAGLAIGAGLGVAVKVAGDFDQSLRNMASVAKPTVEEFEAIHDMALKLGRESIHGPRKLAEVTYTLASAGMKAAKQMKVLPGISMLAAATQFELARATNLTISALNQFGYAADQTDRVINVFAASTQLSQARMDLLEQSMREAGAAAGQFGMDIEDVVAPLMAFYDKGVVASTAGTSFKNIILLLNKGTPELEELLKRLNLTLADVSPVTHTVAEAFQIMADKGATAIDMTKAFGQENALVASVMMSGLDKINKYKDGIAGTKAAYEMAKEQAEGFGQTLALTKAALEGAGIAVGEVLLPAVKDIAIYVATAAIALSDINPKLLDVGVKGAAATGGLLLLGGVLGKVKGFTVGLGTKLVTLADKIAYLGLSAKLSGLGALLPALIPVALGGLALSTAARIDKLAEAEGAWARKRESIYGRMKATEDMFDPTTAEYADSMAQLNKELTVLADAYLASADYAEVAAGGIEEVGEAALTASERAEALVTSLIEGVTAAFDKVGGAATEARDPFAEFLTTLGDSVPLLEKANALLNSTAWAGTAVADATSQIVPPLVAVGEQIAMLSDPLITFADEFQAFFAADGPAILSDWMGIAQQAFTGMEKMHGGFGKAIKAASMGFLKDSLKMLIRAKALELAGISITEQGKAVMTGQWWRIPIIAAGYGLAMSGLNRMKSFDESAVVTRGGSLSGNVSIGDVIVSPDALRNFMKGGGGGRSLQVNVTFAGSYAGDSAGFRDDIDYLVERVELAMER